MSIITLEAIKAQQTRITEMIARFEAQAKIDYVIPKAAIVLHAGERYAGIILDEEGKPAYHLVLLPGETGRVKWQAAVEWAAEQGGELPTRCEQSLLFANLKDQFASNYYWSSERHKDNYGYAWSQNFGDGRQLNYNASAELRARAIRRVFINSDSIQGN